MRPRSSVCGRVMRSLPRDMMRPFRLGEECHSEANMKCHSMASWYILGAARGEIDRVSTRTQMLIGGALKLDRSEGPLKLGLVCMFVFGDAADAAICCCHEQRVRAIDALWPCRLYDACDASTIWWAGTVGSLSTENGSRWIVAKGGEKARLGLHREEASADEAEEAGAGTRA
jgi:hypothetical protein